MEWRIERRKINFVLIWFDFKSRQTNKTKNKRWGGQKAQQKKGGKENVSARAKKQTRASRTRTHIYSKNSTTKKAIRYRYRLHLPRHRNLAVPTSRSKRLHKNTPTFLPTRPGRRAREVFSISSTWNIASIRAWRRRGCRRVYPTPSLDWCRRCLELDHLMSMAFKMKTVKILKPPSK